LAQSAGENTRINIILNESNVPKNKVAPISRVIDSARSSSLEVRGSRASNESDARSQASAYLQEFKIINDKAR